MYILFASGGIESYLWGVLTGYHLNSTLFYLCCFQWDLFRYAELDCWQTMLKRLYKKEAEQVVMRHEEYRQALQRELETKQQEEEQLLSSQALADLDELDKELAKY